ncbi:hypothetical protein QYE76_043492 [Lolium multiflorum]|uniref:DUF4283 domain-containing protein n=1 Tax=Lolium multiflorum TaxID=4521 RepID=A0AAD8TH69_LOLMU|nr:hypothetical protein QYE76_043492 [Lolium multiflorum]
MAPLCSSSCAADSEVSSPARPDGSGDASPWSPARSALLLRSLRGRSRSVPCSVDHGGSHPARLSAQQSVARPRLQSIAVLPSQPSVNISAPSHPHDWQVVSARHGRISGTFPISPARPAPPRLPSDRRTSESTSPSALAARAAFLRRFHGLCFRCLSKNHRRADCRDPVRCIECKQWGHSSSSPRCPVRRRLPELRAPPAPPQQPLRDRLRFTAPPPSSEMLRSVPSRPAPRRDSSRAPTVIVTDRALDNEARSLRSRGVIVKAMEQPHTANPLLVGKELEAALRLPPHILRVTKHHPEAFFVKFDYPKHRDDALRLGRITVDGQPFLLQPWREADHAVHQTWTLHVRVCVERMPLHMWNIKGAQDVLGRHVLVDRLDSRTYGQENTAIFSCWVWCWDLAHIPSSHPFIAFPEGSGRVEEMLGYSPPTRQVAPPPNGLLFDALIHIDLVEDWRVPDRRTPSSGQSGLPSSSSEDEPPYPAIQPYTWVMTVPDDGGARRGPILGGCSGGPGPSRRRDHDDDGDSFDRQRFFRQLPVVQRRPPSRGSTPTSGLRGDRQRSRSPRGGGHRRRASATPPLAHEELPPPPPLPTDGPVPLLAFPPGAAAPLTTSSVAITAAPSSPPRRDHSPVSSASSDPLADFMCVDQFDIGGWAPHRLDPMCMEIEALCIASTQQPMLFSPGPSNLVPESSPLLLDAPPTPVPDELPPPAEGALAQDLLQGLFSAPPASVLGTTPPSPRIARNDPPTASRRITRSSSKWAGTPVSQRATLRLARELAAIDPAEQSAEKAATALLGRFSEPLSSTDIDGLALLARVDREAIVRAASRAGSEGAAAAAH